MLKIIGIISVVLLVIIIALIIYSCCVISGKNSRQEEELERICRTNSLSDLENATLESLLRAFEEDGVNFVINDEKVIDYETNECD